MANPESAALCSYWLASSQVASFSSFFTVILQLFVLIYKQLCLIWSHLYIFFVNYIFLNPLIV